MNVFAIGFLLITCTQAAFLKHSDLSLNSLNSTQTLFNDSINVQTSYLESENSQWIKGCIASAITIFLAEFGDKTFFINCILAMTNNVILVLLGCICGIILINLCSCLLGKILPAFLTRKTTLIISACLFVVLGVIMIVKGCKGDDDEEEEAEEEINKKKAKNSKFSCLYVGAFLQALSLNFFAEWGDTSQIITILISSNYPLLSVFIGSSIGNILCSCLAIFVGKILMKALKPSCISITGGIVFLFFAIQLFVFEN